MPKILPDILQSIPFYLKKIVAFYVQYWKLSKLKYVTKTTFDKTNFERTWGQLSLKRAEFGSNSRNSRHCCEMNLINGGLERAKILLETASFQRKNAYSKFEDESDQMMSWFRMNFLPST